MRQMCEMLRHPVLGALPFMIYQETHIATMTCELKCCTLLLRTMLYFNDCRAWTVLVQTYKNISGEGLNLPHSPFKHGLFFCRCYFDSDADILSSLRQSIGVKLNYLAMDALKFALFLCLYVFPNTTSSLTCEVGYQMSIAGKSGSVLHEAKCPNDGASYVCLKAEIKARVLFFSGENEDVLV